MICVMLCDVIWFAVICCHLIRIYFCVVKWCDFYLLSVFWFSVLFSVEMCYAVVRCDLMWYDVMLCDVMLCDVMWCEVKWSVVSLLCCAVMWRLVWFEMLSNAVICYAVLWCYVMWYDVMWCGLVVALCHMLHSVSSAVLWCGGCDVT